MHELAVCQALLDQVAEVARERNASAVSSITVRIGPLSGVVPELLERAFTVARAGGIAADAELLVETESVRVRCRGCGEENATSPNRLRCPACGQVPVDLVSGDALTLASMTLERTGDPFASPTNDEEARHV